MNTVTTPGGFSNPMGDESIKVYDERLEREISNIVGKHSVKVEQENRETVWVINNFSGLVIELIEHYEIIKRESKKV